ncbi:MAG: DUF262 domain-containing protein [Eubacteriales bacterium]
MSEITGTVIKLRDFLFDVDTQITIKYNGQKHPILAFAKGRILSIPDYQREIRWKKETLFALMNDISHGNKFLGNIILSSANDRDYYIIDGQQRLVSLNMLVNYIKFEYQDEINDIEKLVDIKLNCFNKFDIFQSSRYNLKSVNSAQQTAVEESDKLNQIKSLSALYRYIGTSKIIDTPDKARIFLENLKSSQINVIVADEEDVKKSTEYYIDVNLKGIKLDTEDIFKGYLFAQDATATIRNSWVELKEAWIKFDENLASTNLSNAYSLTKILEHYMYCHVFCKPEYDMIHMDEEFLLIDECTVKGTIYYSKDHVIKVINNNSLMQEVIDGATRYVNCLNSIVEDDGGVPGCMKTYLKSIDSTERQIICNIIKKSILDKGLIVPKMLVLKYFLQIESSSASKNDCKKIFAVYFYTVLFMLFGDKKSDAEKIKKVAKSNDFYKDLISEIKTFVSASKMATTHLTAISRWNSNFENEDLQYKCKSLATIYNYFKLENNVVSVTSVDNLNSFLSNEEKYSVEHFVINKSGTIKYLDDKDEYHLPENTRQYGTYIFNFIFIPRKLNGTVLGNYSLQRKLRILKEDNNLKDIDCEYSKMIISTLDGKFNGAIDVKTLNEQETEELDKYWLVTFKREYPQFTEAVIDEVVKRLRENTK